jgi:hypothetical protein
LAIVAFWLNVIFTSSIDIPHGGLVMVQRNVYAVPAVPVKVLIGLVGVAIVPPAPLTILQEPIPVTGALPAKVTVVNPQVEIPV